MHLESSLTESGKSLSNHDLSPSRDKTHAEALTLCWCRLEAEVPCQVVTHTHSQLEPMASPAFQAESYGNMLSLQQFVQLRGGGRQDTSFAKQNSHLIYQHETSSL